jgi:hypothetical protein
MAFRVRLDNFVLQTEELQPGQENTPEKSFNRCLEQAIGFIQSNFGWAGNSPAPPQPNKGGTATTIIPGDVFKMYSRTVDPTDYHVEIRYDYEDDTLVPPLRRTNHLVWRVVEVP